MPRDAVSQRNRIGPFTSVRDRASVRSCSSDSESPGSRTGGCDISSLVSERVFGLEVSAAVRRGHHKQVCSDEAHLILFE